MKRLMFLMLIMSFLSLSAFAQGLNKVVFGPLEGDGAGIMTVRNDQDIEVELWVRTDPENPTVVCGVAHGLLSADSVIAFRNGMNLEPEYDQPDWEVVFVDGPFVHNPDDAFPIPEGFTSEVQNAYCLWCECFLDTGGEWDLYGSWLMVTNTDVATGQTYYPYSMGWYPHSGQGTTWAFVPGQGTIVPEQDYCGLYFEPDEDLNKVVFGPLEGDGAGVLTVRNGESIEVETWVRTDPDNPYPVIGVAHGLMSENVIISERNGMVPEPEYDTPNWEEFWVYGPFTNDPDDDFPIPEGWTCEMQGAIWLSESEGDPLDTQGEWALYGTWLMGTNTGIPIEQTYYPFADGWFPHNGEGTVWGWYSGGTVPETEFCGLYFEPDTCIYIPGDVNRNGVPLELVDVLAMIESYRGSIETYMCTCTEGSPYLGFAATADPNGNCVANELGDVMTEMAAYRGTVAASGCPDCPGH